MDLIDPPAKPREATILELRDFSRKLVRETGFMRATLADSDWAPSAVHAILEIGMAPGINARDLGNILRLDKSNTSRQLARLEAAGVVERRVSSDDARAIELYLTAEGKAPEENRHVRDGSGVERAAPHGARRPAGAAALARAVCRCARAGQRRESARRGTRRARDPRGYQPGCIGDIASLHARFYAEHWGFGAFFESAWRPSWPSSPVRCRPTARRWLCQEDGRTLASLAIDGDPATGVAHLRWFIVNDALRGSGIGRRLMTEAMRFVDAQRFRETYLWTFKGWTRRAICTSRSALR